MGVVEVNYEWVTWHTTLGTSEEYRCLLQYKQWVSMDDV